MFTQNLMLRIRIFLGILPLIAVVILIFINSEIIQRNLFILIVISFLLLSLSMNFKYKEKEENKNIEITERNAWDIWFYSVPAIIITLFFIGILANEKEVWKWVSISLGSVAGLESLSSLIKSFRL